GTVGASMSAAFVRSTIEEARPAPRRTTGVVAWLQKNLFATPADTILTLLGIAFLIWSVPPIYNFLIGHAVPPGGTVEQCRVENAGACWAYIDARITFFIYGFFPAEEYWRANLVFLLGAVLLIPLLWPQVPFKRTNAILFFAVYPVVTYYLLNGGVFGLRPVPTEQ